MQTLRLTLHSDPGHGWLEVPKSLIPFDIKDRITSCSYQDTDNFYLEEDDDAPFIFGELKKRYKIVIDHKDYDDDAPIRLMKSV